MLMCLTFCSYLFQDIFGKLVLPNNLKPTKLGIIFTITYLNFELADLVNEYHHSLECYARTGSFEF